MKLPYAIAVLVSMGLAGCDEETPPGGARGAEAEAEPAAAETEASPRERIEGEGAAGEPGGEWAGARVDAYGISFARLEEVEEHTELESGIASARTVAPSGLVFSVISSPSIVPAEEAREIQLANARAAAASRGRIVDDGGDAPTRELAGAPREGKRVVYVNPMGGTWHTEVFAWSADDRTVNVIIELPDPPDAHEDVLRTLGRSLRVRAP
jgi:hypothetical protein